MSAILQVKAAVIGSPFESVGKLVKHISGFPYRRKHPELTEVFLEEGRLPIVLKKLLRDDSNVVDVGCHIGSFLSEVSNIASHGDHIGIEASPAKAKALTRKFAKSQIINVAVSDRDGTATFEDNTARPGFSKLAGDVRSVGNQYYDVPVTTLDAVLVHHVDLLKLDIEGHELAALRGAQLTISKYRMPIIFECGAECDIAPGHRRGMYDFFAGINYDVLTFADFLFDRGPIEFDEFRRTGLYPFRAFNFLALPAAE